MNSKPTLFLDIDGVMVTTRQHFEHMHPEYHASYFDKKCVKVLNEILKKRRGSVIVLSSDWKLSYELPRMEKIFTEFGITTMVTDITPDLWGVQFTSLKQLDECRATEILQYVKEHELTNWVAIDDLNLFPWIPDNFVRCTHSTEGIKQSGVKDKILKILI